MIDGIDVKFGVGLGLMLVSLWLIELLFWVVNGELKRRIYEFGG